MIDGFPLSFFLPLVVHALAALTTGVTGVITFSRPKRSVRHPRWGVRYLWAYTVVFLTAIILSVQHLFFVIQPWLILKISEPACLWPRR